MTEKIKLILAILLLAAGVGAFYQLGQDHALVLRVLAVLAGVVAAAAVMWTTPLGKTVFNFGRESVAEAKKVVWPTRKETLQTTLVVFALVVVMGIFLWIVDVGLMWIVGLLMGRSA